MNSKKTTPKNNYITWEKNVRKTYLCRYYNDETIINTKTHFYTDEEFFELFCIENDFAKQFAKWQALLKYFILHIMIISENDTFLHYKTNQVSLCCKILQNAFLTSE